MTFFFVFHLCGLAFPVDSIVLYLLFSFFYVTREFGRFLHRGWAEKSVNKRPSWLTLVTRLNKNMCLRNLHGYQACFGLNERRTNERSCAVNYGVWLPSKFKVVLWYSNMQLNNNNNNNNKKKKKKKNWIMKWWHLIRHGTQWSVFDQTGHSLTR